MSKVERRDIVVRRFNIKDVLVDDLTDSELMEIVNMMEADMEQESLVRRQSGHVYLFAYIALNYAMRLYKIENLEKAKQKAEEKRLDETIKKLEDFLKKP